jgi:PAS domain S-box-containing protein
MVRAIRAMYTVLYVDDEQDLLDLTRLFLERSPDFCVKTQISAQAALDSPLISTCDVIVSDYQMPEMDGIAFLKAVRKRFGALPFILFTGRGREEVVIEAINNGVDFYLQKGGDPKSQFAELSHKIKMAVERKRAVDEHSESEKRFSSIFNASPIHQMITGFSTGRILDINDRFLKDITLSRSEVIGRTMDEIGLFIDNTQYSAIIRQLERDGMVRNAELLIRARSGRTYTTLTSLTRVQDHNQDLIYTQSVDITAQKKAQQTINALLNAPPDVSLLLDTNGVILAANNAASVRYGQPVQNLIGMDAFTLISPDLADLRRKKINEAIATREPLVYLDDRTGRSYENHLYPVIGPDGEVGAVAIHSHEITEERQAKEALKESEEKYRLVVEHSHDCIYIYRDNHFLFINRQTEEFSGFSHDELMKRELWDFIHPDDRKRLKDAAAKRFAGGHVSSSFQAKILRKNGEVREGEFFVDLVDFRGKQAILGIARDVTDKKRAEEELKAAYEQLAASQQELKSRFDELKAGEELLRESEEKYRTLVEHTDDGVFITQNGVILFVNPAFTSMTGYVPEELTGRSFTPLIAPEDREMVFSRHMTPQKGKSLPEKYEFSLMHHDGITRVRVQIRQGTMTFRGAPATIGTLHDITEERRREKALAQSEELHRKMVSAVPDIIVQADLDGTILYINENGVKLTGFADVSEVTGKSMFSFFAPESRQLALANTPLMFERPLGPVEYTFLTRENRHVALEVNGDVLRTPEGIPYGMVFICRDISGRKKAEAALRESEENYWLIIDNMQDVFYRINREGIFTMISSFGARLLGFESPADIIGKYAATDFYADPNEREKFLSYLHRERVISGYPLTIRDRRGNLHYATASSRLLYDEEGKVNGIEGILHDVTHLKRVENALRQANRQLTLMTSITRHDIHNQLMALRGWLELSRASVSDPERMRDLITREQRIAAIIEEQINFTTFFEEMGVKEPVWQDPVAFIRNSQSTLPFKTIRLDVEISGIEIFADPLFEKVFYNLFDNAIRYGGETLTEIRVAAYPDGSNLILVIEDNGSGILEKDKERLFERGFGKNTGLGLFLVKEIISITGMTIRETGITGKGARFEIRVPAGKYRLVEK